MFDCEEGIGTDLQEVEKKIGKSHQRGCFPQGKIATGIESHWKDAFEEEW